MSVKMQRRVSAPGAGTAPLSARGPRTFGAYSPRERVSGTPSRPDAAAATVRPSMWLTKQNKAGWWTGPSELCMKLGELPMGFHITEAAVQHTFPVQGADMKLWVAVEPRGYMRLQDLVPLGSPGAEQLTQQHPHGGMATPRQSLDSTHQQHQQTRAEHEKLQREVESLKEKRVTLLRNITDEQEQLRLCSLQRRVLEDKLTRCRECIERVVGHIDYIYSFPQEDPEGVDKHLTSLESESSTVGQLLQELDDDDDSCWKDDDEDDADEENRPPMSENVNHQAGVCAAKKSIPPLKLSLVNETAQQTNGAGKEMRLAGAAGGEHFSERPRQMIRQNLR